MGEIVPSSGPIRPPYDLARHDLGLKPGPEDGKERTLKSLEKRAVKRQDRLEKLWENVKKSFEHSGDDRERDAAFKFLAYAFGEGKFREAWRSAQAAGRPARYRLARLLLAECRFGVATKELASLADAKDSLAWKALSVLVRHAEERKAMQRKALIPLDFDIEGYLARRSKDERTWSASGGGDGPCGDVPRPVSCP